ncbi:MAG: hypothetical protein LBL91_01705 [Lachnospiraceae bacterium]|jgi:uncharacterized membrane protein YjjB (DUF3815 family)|nr:hypothetical protein [Lachnospiraceae bacterium]
MKKKTITGTDISKFVSILGIIACIGELIYQFISKNNDYVIWVVFLVALSLNCLAIQMFQKKAEDIQKEDKK